MSQFSEREEEERNVSIIQMMGNALKANVQAMFDKVDFDAEGKKLMLSLGINESTHDEQGNLSAIFRHPGGGTIYVGNVYVAQSLSILEQFNIKGVVNCTHGHGALPNFHEGKPGAPKYYVFPISTWWTSLNATNASVYAFTDPMFSFITEMISQGNNVLVHCLAGAHRAGTTGCACLMHFAQMDQKTAISTAKSLRPIIDPIGTLPDFLRRLEQAQKERKEKEKAKNKP